MICHYWYFKDIGSKYEGELCSGNISKMAYELENIAILNVKGFNYRCVIGNMTRNDANNRLNNSNLDYKGSL